MLVLNSKIRKYANGPMHFVLKKTGKIIISKKYKINSEVPLRLPARSFEDVVSSHLCAAHGQIHVSAHGGEDHFGDLRKKQKNEFDSGDRNLGIVTPIPLRSTTTSHITIPHDGR